MKNLTPAIVVAIICLAFSLAGLVVVCVASANMHIALILILAWYLAATGIFYWRNRKYRSQR